MARLIMSFSKSSRLRLAILMLLQFMIGETGAKVNNVELKQFLGFSTSFGFPACPVLVNGLTWNVLGMQNYPCTVGQIPTRYKNVLLKSNYLPIN